MKRFYQHPRHVTILLIILVLTVSCSLIKARPTRVKPKPKPTSSQQTSKPDVSDVSEDNQPGSTTVGSRAG